MSCMLMGNDQVRIVGLSSRARVARALYHFSGRRVAVCFLNVCVQSSRCDLAQVGNECMQAPKASPGSINPSHRNIMVS